MTLRRRTQSRSSRQFWTAPSASWIRRMGTRMAAVKNVSARESAHTERAGRSGRDTVRVAQRRRDRACRPCRRRRARDEQVPRALAVRGCPGSQPLDARRSQCGSDDRSGTGARCRGGQRGDLGGGILANPRGGGTSYGYRDARPATLRAIAALADLSQEWGTDLATVALCASLRDDRIASTIIGFSKKERLSGILAGSGMSFLEEFWQRVDDLLPPPENWLDAR